ncbi:Uncharacterised protein [Collinsella intestinalis]|nr:Uncharacterised protein [Collinsella intestinalis]
MGQVAVVAPHQAEAGDVDHRLGLLIGHLAAHADRDLSVFDAVCHVVVILDTAGPAVDDALADARLLNHLMRGETAIGVVGHVPGEVLPLVCLEVEHEQAAHLADVGVEAQDARILVHHHTSAAGARNDLDAGALESHYGLNECGARVALVIRESARARRQHGGVQVGEDVLHASELFAQLACGLGGKDGVVREVEVAHGSLSRDEGSSSPS